MSTHKVTFQSLISAPSEARNVPFTFPTLGGSRLRHL